MITATSSTASSCARSWRARWCPSGRSIRWRRRRACRCAAARGRRSWWSAWTRGPEGDGRNPNLTLKSARGGTRQRDEKEGEFSRVVRGSTVSRPAPFPRRSVSARGVQDRGRTRWPRRRWFSAGACGWLARENKHPSRFFVCLGVLNPR